MRAQGQGLRGSRAEDRNQVQLLGRQAGLWGKGGLALEKERAVAPSLTHRQLPGPDSVHGSQALGARVPRRGVPGVG